MAAQVALKRKQAQEDALAMHQDIGLEGDQVLSPGSSGSNEGFQNQQDNPDTPPAESDTESIIDPVSSPPPSHNLPRFEVQRRRSDLDILRNLFPDVNGRTLEIVLQESSGDLSKALEHLLFMRNMSPPISPPLSPPPTVRQYYPPQSFPKPLCPQIPDTPSYISHRPYLPSYPVCTLPGCLQCSPSKITEYVASTSPVDLSGRSSQRYHHHHPLLNYH
ncbi:hypothetical protein LAZ67_11002978 [Cordylochernes scorpioides]|uniref:DMA domain-containing protein n=1 Tax=Cordylochernes scorpioides TaxID=51811 RepID=A0ABY6L4F0_9ARAC|nr:hypothetical protein LAZ67_11002978 [Cordylochernes scorpioides]